ncbi:hypothetical protein FH139_02290 [Staphylococcus hominis]|uniref:hypothetical protein n=1 Tax=Staphylococcus hominis TaxID=1290 RepID=UPI001F594106|nr:hypothetical protein [Staphylococcus hominis]MCI2926649.1 hypothetical protein [Staphylococcus hominis]
MAKDPKFVVHGSQVQKWTDDIQQLKQERDAYKKQRDELINDMAEVKRKAEAYDKIKEAADSEKLNGYSLYDNERFIDRLCHVFDEMEADH